MEYNTQRSDLIISEYGRNIQRMVDHALQLETRDERTKAANAIVNAMVVLNPQIKEYNDYRIKLWDHLFIMSNYKLDCESPFPMPSPEKRMLKPEKIPYPTYNIKYRHYGTIVLKMIEEASAMEEGVTKDQVALMIANFMKQSYVNYNRDNVNDEVIMDHLRKLSNGKITLKDDVRLRYVSEVKPAAFSTGGKKKKKKKKKHSSQ
jgi:RNase H-fold protein (predicted Holliday junction resolvase)